VRIISSLAKEREWKLLEHPVVEHFYSPRIFSWQRQLSAKNKLNTHILMLSLDIHNDERGREDGLTDTQHS
jgi:hypothetical protein